MLSGTNHVHRLVLISRFFFLPLIVGYFASIFFSFYMCAAYVFIYKVSLLVGGYTYVSVHALATSPYGEQRLI